MERVAITTFDNPFNPFTQFREWFMYDVLNGYNTCGYLARVSRENDLMSETEKIEENERAIDEMIKYDFRGIYKKVKENNKNIRNIT